MRSSSSPIVLPSTSRCASAVLERERAGEDARAHHRRREARAFLVGPDRDLDRRLGLRSRCRSACGPPRARPARRSCRRTCRPSAGVSMWLPVADRRAGCRCGPARRVKMLPIWSIVTVQPASLHQPTNRSRPCPSRSVSARRQTPPFGVAPILAISIRLAHRRLPLIFMVTPSVAIGARQLDDLGIAAPVCRALCNCGTRLVTQNRLAEKHGAQRCFRPEAAFWSAVVG